MRVVEDGMTERALFCREIVLMIGCMYDWVHVSSVFKKILGIVMILWLLFFHNQSLVVS